jgi:hypothetical protein
MWKVNARLLDRPKKGAEEKICFWVAAGMDMRQPFWRICRLHSERRTFFLGNG